MQIYDVLKKDHVAIKDMLDELVNFDGTDDERSDLIEDIRNELIPHSRAEESVFYNSMRVAEIPVNVLHSYREHMEAEMLLRALQLRDKIDADWRKSAQRLKEAVEHHIEEEESMIFEAARKGFTEQEADLMGKAFEKLKAKIATEGSIKTTMDFIANIMPPRFAKGLRGHERQPRI